MRRSSGGFSLVELAVTLAATGIIGMAVWRVLPASRDVAAGQPEAVQLAQAQAATEGFILRNHRLPCPDTDADGREDCGAGSQGRLAWRDLGLSQSFAGLRYGVHRSAVTDLAAAAPRHTPLLPPGFTASVVNGLDFCAAAYAAALAPGAAGALTAGGIEVAYALAHPGKDGQFQGMNATGFELPGPAATPGYDDLVAAAGMTELSGRLACPTRLAGSNAAARSAYAAYDIDRTAQQFLQFRTFASDVSAANTAIAGVNLGLASVGLAASIAKTATAIAIALNSAGVGAGVVVAAIVGIGGATAGEVVASAQLGLAIVAQAKAQAQAAGAAAFQARTTVERVDAGATAVSTDSKGLVP